MNFSKIVIVNFRSRQVFYLPCYELFLAEAMRKHNLVDDIKIYTIFDYENPKKYLSQWKDADLIICWESFSTKAPTYANSYFKFAKKMKQILRVPIYFGGFWATSYGRYFDEFSIFDKIIEGFSIDGLVNALSNDKDSDGRFITIYGDSNYDKYPLNLDFLATPEKYIYNNILFGYMSSFSCPNNCKFCFANAARYFKSGFSSRDIKTIKRDIDTLDKYFNFKGFAPKDLNIFYDRERAFNFLGYLKEKGKTIDINLDITIKDFDEELISELKKLGIANYLYFGLESFNPEIRKKVGKPYDDSELERAFDLADKHSINITGNIIIGLPWQTIEDVQNDIKKALYYINRYKHVFIMMNAYKPEYGTYIQREFFNDLHKKVNFKELVDVYLNNVSKYQNKIYGDKFNSLNIEKLFNLMRLVNNSKRFLNREPPRFRGKLLQFLHGLFEKQLKSQPYIPNLLLRILLRRNLVTFTGNFIFPLLSFKFLDFSFVKVNHFLKRTTRYIQSVTRFIIL